MRNDTAKTPTEEELRIAEKAYEEADPTQFSTLPPDELESTKVNADVARFSPMASNGIDTFIELSEFKSPEVQQILVRLLKGIVPVADIVRVKGNNQDTFFSKKLDHTHIASSSSPDAEMAADIDFMHLVFGDSDHDVLNGRQVRGKETKNAVNENSAISYYDFSEFDLSQKVQLINVHTPTSVKLLLEKISSLRERLAGRDGHVYIESIIKDLHADALIFNKGPVRNPVIAEELQHILLERLEDAEHKVRVREQEVSWHHSDSE